MGNGIGKVSDCIACDGAISRRHDIAVIVSKPLDEGLGHSFCYIRPDQTLFSSSKVHSEMDTATTQTTTFRSISGASVSANTATPLSTALADICTHSTTLDKAASFESSDSFASIPLQPVPQNGSGNLSSSIERGFLSGPIERGFTSGPIDRGLYSGPIERNLQRSFSSGFKMKPKKRNLIKIFQRAIASTISRRHKSIVAPIKGVKESDLDKNNEILTVRSTTMSGSVSLNDSDEDDFSMESLNLQWAQGKAGEDRVHIVISEEHGWVFVGIYDGFNGPDAPDYLLSYLYNAVQKELKGLLWYDKFESMAIKSTDSSNSEEIDQTRMRNQMVDDCSLRFDKENYPLGNGELDLDSNSDSNLKRKHKNLKSRSKGVAKKWEESQRMWKCEWNRERLELDRKLKEKLNDSGSDKAAKINHSDVLNAISEALRKTEDAYLDIADEMVTENPELALMGSCVLVMLMKGEDVYLLNVGDSRAVLARKAEPDIGIGRALQDLGKINEETKHDLEASDVDDLPSLTSYQLTVEHSTYVKQEVKRIKNEHPDDASAVTNDRVKGNLKVTRAFGAGFLKQPKWNNALLETFRINYVGTSPYITCLPSLCHHRLSPRDRFLILSSDGLYQYFTNEEAVLEVESFLASFPEGDPAQHLIEELLFRAAKKARMDFHKLLDIRQGGRRQYHDDVSIIIISLEGSIWNSSV